MLLSAQILSDVADVNRYRVIPQVEARAGSTIEVYLRLVNREADKELNPPGRRFIPAPNSTLIVNLRSVYARKQLAYQCSIPFPEDRSIWKFVISANDGRFAPAPGGGPIIDYSNLVPLGQPFDFNTIITDQGMVGTFGLILTLTENPGMTATASLLNVGVGDVVVINSISFTCVASGATGAQFDVGATDADTASNLADAINANSTTCQVTGLASDATVVVTAVRAANIVWTSTSQHFTLGAPALGSRARVTTGWATSAISIAPGFPAV
jgi:hypothetical protein